MTLKSKYLPGAHTFARFLYVFHNQRFLIMFRSCMVWHIAFIISVCDRFCDCCTYQNNYFPRQVKTVLLKQHTLKNMNCTILCSCQRSGRNSFRNVHWDNEICIVLLFHALFCLVLFSPGSHSASSYTLPSFGQEAPLLHWNSWTCGCSCPLCHWPTRNSMCCSLSRREGLLLMGL